MRAGIAGQWLYDSATIQAYRKINAAGQWIDRTEQVSLNDLFDRMSTEELEEYAQTGTLPKWFEAEAQTATGSDGGNEGEPTQDAPKADHCPRQPRVEPWDPHPACMPTGETFEPESVDRHQLIYLMDGKGSIRLDAKSYDVERGAGVFASRAAPRLTRRMRAAFSSSPAATA